MVYGLIDISISFVPPPFMPSTDKSTMITPVTSFSSVQYVIVTPFLSANALAVKPSGSVSPTACRNPSG